LSFSRLIKSSEDFDIVNISPKNVRGKYLFEVPPNVDDVEIMRRALVFSQQQLLKEAATEGWNSLVKEG